MIEIKKKGRVLPVMKATVFRSFQEDWGTPGYLVLETGWKCDTLELQWRDNKKGVSCIKPDTYSAVVWKSPTLGSKADNKNTELDETHMVYRLEDKHGRGDVLIHNGNFAGDVEKGLLTQIHGCTLVGKGFTELERTDGVKTRQMGIVESVKTLLELMKQTGGAPLDVEYRYVAGCEPK